VQPMRLRMTPPQMFAGISLLLIAVVLAVSDLTQSSYFRQGIIEREAAIIRDMVKAMVQEEELEEELAPADMEHYVEIAAKKRFDHTFRALSTLPGVVRVKLFNRDKTIVWSDEPRLIGTNLTGNKQDLARALGGEVRAVFDPPERGDNPVEGLPRMPLIEFYVPFTLTDPGAASGTVSGVLALYRSPKEVNDLIRNGLLLLWSATGLAAGILFFALYWLFRSVYYNQRAAEMQFARLSSEHDRMMRIEKLSAMGQMVSEIAHQLNNPLVGVINLTELAERELGNPQRVKELLGEVRRAGDHCHGFVQRMLLINRAAHSEPQTTDMNRLVRDTIAFFHEGLGGHPPVIFEEPDQQVTMKVDPVLIRNALFNLIHNAAQADPIGPVTVSLALDERDGVSGCRLTVSDNGSGLTSEVAGKLFTPFFTTRPGGTGLGLSIAQHIAAQHGGGIRAENKPGGGARFIIWLPANKANA
jgi:signal transduction histidine kinase